MPIVNMLCPPDTKHFLWSPRKIKKIYTLSHFINFCKESANELEPLTGQGNEWFNQVPCDLRVDPLNRVNKFLLLNSEMTKPIRTILLKSGLEH